MGCLWLNGKHGFVRTDKTLQGPTTLQGPSLPLPCQGQNTAGQESSLQGADQASYGIKWWRYRDSDSSTAQTLCPKASLCGLCFLCYLNHRAHLSAFVTATAQHSTQHQRGSCWSNKLFCIFFIVIIFVFLVNSNPKAFKGVHATLADAHLGKAPSQLPSQHTVSMNLKPSACTCCAPNSTAYGLADAFHLILGKLRWAK